MEKGFQGVMGRTIDESQQAWEKPVRAPKGAPNIVFWVIDDTGFGQTSPFGGLIEMPTLERLAERGLRYTNCHTTALCSPTRSCLLTGRNHHSNHMAAITETSTGFPGSDGRIPFANGFLSEILTPLGYGAYAIGKWHLTPVEETHMGGARDRWPLGRGFERYYGFLGGETNQWVPDLVHDNHAIPVPECEPYYHLTEDLTDKAIAFVKDLKMVAPSKPFFLYLAYGANHAPHHAPKAWIERYKGRFDMGWDQYREQVLQRQIEMGILPPGTELSPEDPDVPRWDSIPPEEQRLYARFMETYAGFCSHMDHHVGRLIDFLEEIGQLDNTLIVFISDNGASAEGGPTGLISENDFFNNLAGSVQRNLERIDDIGGPTAYNHYPWGWAWAGNTPFRRWKRETYRGGVSDPCVVFWPQGIQAQGEMRSQFIHAIDVVPTVLEVLGIEPPETIKGVAQSPIEGTSFAYTFADAKAPERHITQYFEMFGHRSLYHEGWRAVCPWPGPSFLEAGRPFGAPLMSDDLNRLEASGWELYHVAEDPAECHNLAKQFPEKLRELISMWWVEAGKYNVLPIDGRGTSRLVEERPGAEETRNRYTYFTGASPVPSEAAVDVRNRSHSIAAQVIIPDAGAEGVLLANGGSVGGYTFYVKDGLLHYEHNYLGIMCYRVVAMQPVPAGPCWLTCEFNVTVPADVAAGRGAGGQVRLYVNDQLVGEGLVETTCPLSYALAGEGLSCGYDSGEAVSNDYVAPFAFTGTVRKVVVDVSGKPFQDLVAQARMALARQ